MHGEHGEEESTSFNNTLKMKKQKGEIMEFEAMEQQRFCARLMRAIRVETQAEVDETEQKGMGIIVLTARKNVHTAR
ncbi:hypothetical protein MRB53_015745 [Persea americana]|uniref:Uncharacterized protein n=1 Tax=Persea americana TaxID=3435 RepID=A0ACC2M162_PERAE|nr:hypothetical protein MRB53_015745 [Persea americana]